MFARLAILHVQLDKMDETKKLYGDSLIPAAKSQNGYLGAYLLTDGKTGKSISISLWNSEEDAIASEKRPYFQEQLGKFKHLFTAPPISEGYEVSYQD